jgi:hypothetical protein
VLQPAGTARKVQEMHQELRAKREAFVPAEVLCLCHVALLQEITAPQGLVLRLGSLAQSASTVLVSRQLQGRAHALQATIATSVVRHLMVCNALPVTTALAVQQKSPFAQQLLEATVMESCLQHRKGFRVQKDTIVLVALQIRGLVLHSQAATVLQEPVSRRVSSATLDSGVLAE